MDVRLTTYSVGSNKIEALPNDLLFNIVEQLPDGSKKQFLSVNRNLRSLLSHVHFTQSVKCEHLSCCPYPRNHSSIVIDYTNTEELVKALYNPAIPDLLCIPNHVTVVKLEDSTGDCLLEGSLYFGATLKLKELHFGTYRNIRGAVSDSIELVSVTVYHVDRKYRGLVAIPNFGLCERVIQITSSKCSIGEVLYRRVPKELKTIHVYSTKRGSNESVTLIDSYSIPHVSYDLKIEDCTSRT